MSMDMRSAGRWSATMLTNGGRTIIKKDEVCAITMHTTFTEGTTYSIHMKSGTIFTTDKAPQGLPLPNEEGKSGTIFTSKS